MIQLLRNYSLVEDVGDLVSYATHPVVHTWAYHFQGEDSRLQLAQLAILVVGWALPHESDRDCSTMQRRIFPHAQAFSQRVSAGEIGRIIRRHDTNDVDFEEPEENEAILKAIGQLGNLYSHQGKLAEAEKIYEWVLQGYEEAVGPKHTSTLKTVNNLGNICVKQGRLAEAEKMYKQALQGKEEALGSKHTSTLETVGNPGILYKDQGRLAEAEKMYKQALRGYEEALGPKHTSTLNTVNNLGLLYMHQGKLAEAEKTYERALRGYEDAHGLDNVRQYRPALDTMENIGHLYVEQGELTKAREIFLRAFHGFETILGSTSNICRSIKAEIESLDLSLGKTQYIPKPLT